MSDYFALRKFTDRPDILQYTEQLEDVYDQIGKGPRALQEKIAENEDWLLHKLRGQDKETLNGLFLKVYGAQNHCVNWPPLSYPSDAPLLVHVPGFHGESTREWNMRILGLIGRDMTEGYRPQYRGLPYTPDLVGYPAIHIYEKKWLADDNIRRAYDAIKAGQSIGQALNIQVDDEVILTAYSQSGTTFEDVICEQMSAAGRFIANLRSFATFEEFYVGLDRPVTELDATFSTNAIASPKLMRLGLPWPQQFFVVTSDPVASLYTVDSPPPGFATAKTAWIQTRPRESSPNKPSVIQGAFMAGFPEFLQLYFGDIIAVSPSLRDSLVGQETAEELETRIRLTQAFRPNMTAAQLETIVNSVPFTLAGKRPLAASIKEQARYPAQLNLGSFRVGNTVRASPTANPEGILGPAGSGIQGQIVNIDIAANRRPYTVTTGPDYLWAYNAQNLEPAAQRLKTNYEPLMANLKRLRKTFRKPSWHFWKKGPDSLIREIIAKYGDQKLLLRDENIMRAALALQKHHGNKEKDALLDSLEDAIRVRQSRKAVNRATTNYVTLANQLDDTLEELDRAFYDRSWGKADRLIREILDRQLPEFEEKGDAELIRTLRALRANRSASKRKGLVENVRAALEKRRGAPLPGLYDVPQLLGSRTESELAKLQSRVVPITRSGRVVVPLSRQMGGWSPTLMASFAVNGMRLLPIAGYTGYKMFKNWKKTQRRSKGMLSTRESRKRSPRT